MENRNLNDDHVVTLESNMVSHALTLAMPRGCCKNVAEGRGFQQPREGPDET